MNHGRHGPADHTSSKCWARRNDGAFGHRRRTSRASPP